jgi:hypothetical protein
MLCLPRLSVKTVRHKRSDCKGQRGSVSVKIDCTEMKEQNVEVEFNGFGNEDRDRYWNVQR